MEWITYLARAAGAAAIGLFGVAMLAGALVGTDERSLMLGMGVAGCLGAWFSWPRSPNAWRRDPPSEKQLRYAADLGIRVPRGATKGDVSDAISRVTGR